MNPCDICQQEVITEFRVSNDTWASVTGHQTPVDEYAEGYWCIHCFLKKAEQVLPDGEFKIEVFTRREYYLNEVK